jgi:hypothetical protein
MKINWRGGGGENGEMAWRNIGGDSKSKQHGSLLRTSNNDEIINGESEKSAAKYQRK